MRYRLFKRITVKLVSFRKTEWRRYDSGMEPQAEQETSRSRIDVDVQTVGLNAETKKCRHRAGGEDFVLTFPLIGVRPESRANDCLAEKIPTRPGLPWPVP
jgi:hypothetical protein